MTKIKKITLLFSFLLLSGCYTITGQVISAPSVTYFLYESRGEVQDAYRHMTGKDGSDVRGFYYSGTIHCVKWDYVCMGHEVYHHMQYKGEPMLIPDGREHFDNFGKEEK